MGSDLEAIPITSQKHDRAWKHCQMFKNGERVQLKCVYCGKIFKGGGIHRIKEHLAGQKGNAATCLQVPPDVRLLMQQSLDGVVVKKRKKQQIAEEITNLNPVSREVEVFDDDVNTGMELIGVSDAIDPSSSLSDSGENGTRNKGGEKRGRGRGRGSVANAKAVVTSIGRFLYDIGASLDAVNSAYFQPMVEAIALGGSEVVLSSCHDLRGFYLNPKFSYSFEGDIPSEIRSGMYDFIEKFVPDLSVQDTIIKEVNSYKNAAGDFGGRWLLELGTLCFLCFILLEYSNLIFALVNKNEEQDPPISCDSNSILEDWVKGNEVCSDDFETLNWMAVDPPSDDARLWGNSHSEVEDLGAGAY
uniref:BED-type domain-containing protein n=1 Tax=Populus alba TaxID=43335 RepID=A0A4U5R3V3_POPAL|nr:hypothetical protein D5086_0000010100 [Populus alba]